MSKKFLTVLLSSAVLLTTAYTSFSYAADDSAEVYQIKNKGKKWDINTEKTKLHFTVVSNDSGEFKGTFNNGVEGFLRLANEKSKGSFFVRYSKMVTVNKAGKGNPLRDNNLVEAFFGVRDSKVAKKAVNDVWDKLSGVLKKGVSTAQFEIDKVEGLKLASKKEASCNVKGRVILWDKIEIPAVFPVKAKINNNELEIKGTKPFKFNLVKVLGQNTRNTVFQTLLAAGCPHKKGIQNDISIYLDTIVFDKRK